jgi:hypothetical protein
VSLQIEAISESEVFENRSIEVSVSEAEDRILMM